MNVCHDTFGVTIDGEAIERFTLANDRGLELQAINYGGIITALCVPDRGGCPADIVLGFETLRDYERESPYFGAIIGRYANRIAQGQFSLDGVVHQLARNDGVHHLHGGLRGFDRRTWDAEPIENGAAVGVSFSRVSAAGEEQYPGALSVQVSYTLGHENEVAIEYTATTDAATVVNLTQHSYFDLSAGGSGTILDHVLMINGSYYTPVGSDLIPTGALVPVRDTPFDFLSPVPVGSRIATSDPQLAYGRGYDHNWVLDDAGQDTRLAATVHEASSGRTLDIWTSEPGIQLYTGNLLNVQRGKGGRRYPSRSGFCLETQHFPDSPSHPGFPSTVLRAEHVFRSRTVWKFGLK